MICHMLMIFFVETDVFAFVSCSLYCFYVQFAIVVFRFWSLHKPHPPLPFPFLFKFLLTYNYVSIKCLKSPALLFQVFAYLQLLWNFHQVSKTPSSLWPFKEPMNYFLDLQVLPYDQLILEIDVANVRELEDFLINECMYAVSIHWFGIYLSL